ncbi:hypothetical protein GQ43DRAFT_82021 [Delitschia confertaspora ATCC 74209]|uniref:Uncharacterized protein n=1 Tax=Delitschia confertaspora ATCC 74209 TaxID=1513339 RepID=A0A9P4JNS8_9PLEO|nr:hypothetical protein GQ43DRAFT_82021 [Delitschia confertaspora ATCC 74209]
MVEPITSDRLFGDYCDDIHDFSIIFKGLQERLKFDISKDQMTLYVSRAKLKVLQAQRSLGSAHPCYGLREELERVHHKGKYRMYHIYGGHDEPSSRQRLIFVGLDQMFRDDLMEPIAGVLNEPWTAVLIADDPLSLGLVEERVTALVPVIGYVGNYVDLAERATAKLRFHSYSGPLLNVVTIVHRWNQLPVALEMVQQQAKRRQREDRQAMGEESEGAQSVSELEDESDKQPYNAAEKLLTFKSSSIRTRPSANGIQRNPTRLRISELSLESESDRGGLPDSTHSASPQPEHEPALSTEDDNMESPLTNPFANLEPDDDVPSWTSVNRPPSRRPNRWGLPLFDYEDPELSSEPDQYGSLTSTAADPFDDSAAITEEVSCTLTMSPLQRRLQRISEADGEEEAEEEWDGVEDDDEDPSARTSIELDDDVWDMDDNQSKTGEEDPDSARSSPDDYSNALDENDNLSEAEDGNQNHLYGSLRLDGFSDEGREEDGRVRNTGLI